MDSYYGGDLFITGGVENFLGMLAISSDDENSVMSDGSYSSSSVSSSNESSGDRSTHSTTSLEAKNKPVVIDEDNDLAAEFSSSDDDITGEKDGGARHGELVDSDNMYVRNRHGVNKHEIKLNTWAADFTGGVPNKQKNKNKHEPNLIDVDDDSLKEPAADHLYEKTLEPLEPVSVFGEIPVDELVVESVDELVVEPDAKSDAKSDAEPDVEPNKLFGEPLSPDAEPDANSNAEPNEVFGDLIDEIITEPSPTDPKVILEKKKISTILDHHDSRHDNVKDPDAVSTSSSSSDDAIGGGDCSVFGSALRSYHMAL